MKLSLQHVGPLGLLTLVAVPLAASLTGCGVDVSFGSSPGSAPGATPASAPPDDPGARADVPLAPLDHTGLPQWGQWGPEGPPTNGGGAGDRRGSEGLYHLPGMACLVNEHGIRVKVLAAEEGIRCLDQVPGGVLVGSQLKYFYPYFVFDVFPEEGEPEYYLVGPTPRQKSIVGWAPASAMSRWDSRVGVRYKREQGVRLPPLLVYRDQAPLIEWLETGSTQVEPMAKANPRAERTLMPWPVAESELVNVGGQVYELVRINFLGEFVEGADLAAEPEEIQAVPMYTKREMADIQSGVKMLDVVFVVDNTHSTGDFIEAIREAVMRLSRKLHKELPFQPDVNLGLVLYRDYVDGIYFRESAGKSVVRNYGLDGDLQSFLRRVEPIREARESSVDWAEAGYDGLHAALTRTAWRAGQLSTRAIVLIGDNSFHEPGSNKNPKNLGLENVARDARAFGVPIFSLCIDGKGGEQEQRHHWEQFDAISRATGGSCFKLEEADRVVDQIRAIMDGRTEVVYTRSVVLDDLVQGQAPEQIAADHELDVRQVTEVMQFLEGAGVDIDRLGPGVPSFATGWALCEVDGVQITEREVYVARSELDVLLAALNLLSANLSPSLGREAFGLGLSGRIDPLSRFFQGEAPEPLDVFLMAKGIPVGRSSILRMPASEIRHMSEEARAVLRSRIVGTIVPSITNARNDSGIWQYRDDLEFGWIPESVLP